MEVAELWSFAVLLIAAFVIGWAAEAAQTFLPQSIALSILAWLQTLPEFAVEANIAWNQERDLMIANLTGSLRLLVGLGWPMIFFVYFFAQGLRTRKFVKEIRVDDDASLSVLALFISILYFGVILLKRSLTPWDSIVLGIIYVGYLYLGLRFPSKEMEDEEDLPWVARKIVAMSDAPKVLSVIFLFVAGGAALYLSVEPFVETLKHWSVRFGISTFVFVQWIAPFLSEFPEKVSAFNWARQKNKAPMALMNMVSSNINQWTMLAAMIPLVFSLSLGRYGAVELDSFHSMELALTIAQSALGGLLLLDLSFSIGDAIAIFVLWLVQFIDASLREEVAIAYAVWIGWVLARMLVDYLRHRRVPRAVKAIRTYL